MAVSAHARTPEELETLFEDSLVIRDGEALSSLFEGDAVLVLGKARPIRGCDDIVRLVLATWDGDDIYVADPQFVTQARDVALIVAGRAVSVVRRGRDGAWRYAISLHTSDIENERMER